VRHVVSFQLTEQNAYGMFRNNGIMAMKLKASAMHRHELKTRGSRGLNKEVNDYIMVEKPTKF